MAALGANAQGIIQLNHLVQSLKDSENGIYLGLPSADEESGRIVVRVDGAYMTNQQNAKKQNLAGMQVVALDPGETTKWRVVKSCTTLKHIKDYLALAEAADVGDKRKSRCPKCPTIASLKYFQGAALRLYKEKFPYVGICKVCGAGKKNFQPPPQDEDLIITNAEGVPRKDQEGSIINATEILEPLLGGSAVVQGQGSQHVPVYQPAFQQLLHAALGTSGTATASGGGKLSGLPAMSIPVRQDSSRLEALVSAASRGGSATMTPGVGAGSAALFSPNFFQMLNAGGGNGSATGLPLMSPVPITPAHLANLAGAFTMSMNAAQTPITGSRPVMVPPAAGTQPQAPPPPPPSSSTTQAAAAKKVTPGGVGLGGLEGLASPSLPITKDNLAAAMSLLSQWGQQLNGFSSGVPGIPVPPSGPVHVSASQDAEAAQAVPAHLKDEILDMKCTELNKHIKSHNYSDQQVAEIKRERRKKKNRLYAKRSRDRKNATVRASKAREEELQKELETIKKKLPPSERT